MKVLIDADILNKAKNGDMNAVEEICLSFKNIVKSVARKYFLICGEHDDLVQEGMIGLYKGILAFNNDKGNFEAFAMLCIKRQIQTAIKQNNRLKNMVLSTGISLENDRVRESLGDGVEVLNILAEKEEFSDRLRNIKKLLSEQENLVLEKYLQGLSYNEVAASTNLTIRGVENTVARIKTKLKKTKEI